MKSIKPGRGPSMMGGVASVFAAVFGVVWTAATAAMHAPFFFPIFGVCFIVLAAVQAVYNFKNATGKNRFSTFDIVDDNEEPDPLNERFSKDDLQGNGLQKADAAENYSDAGFCPYCGSGVGADFEFCPKCGKRLPK